jgi:hypothetical protein
LDRQFIDFYQGSTLQSDGGVELGGIPGDSVFTFTPLQLSDYTLKLKLSSEMEIHTNQ